MKNLFNALTAYGFERRPSEMFWGVGSLMWGTTVAIKAIGADLYEVVTHRWFYDQNGDQMEDSTSTVAAHANQVWGLIPERVLTGARFYAPV